MFRVLKILRADLPLPMGRQLVARIKDDNGTRMPFYIYALL